MDPITLGVLVWLFATPVLLVMWLLTRRKLQRAIAGASSDAEAHREALAKSEAAHDATKAKYGGIISQ